MRYQWLAGLGTAAALSLSPTPAFAQRTSLNEDVTSAAALRWEFAYLGLSAVDAIQTIQCIERGKCTESNPLFGKRPSAETVILAKLIGSGVQFALFNAARRKDPKLALRLAQVSFALQGTVVALNARFTF